MKARPGIRPEKVEAGLGTFTGVEAVGVRRIAVDITRVGPEQTTCRPGEPMNMEAEGKSEAVATAKCEKYSRKRQAKKRQQSAGEEGDAAELVNPKRPGTLGEKHDGGIELVVKARNQG